MPLCQLCGNELPPSSGRGRKPTHHPECSQASRSLDYAIARISEMDLTIPAKIEIRRRLFAAANSYTQNIGQKRDKRGRYV